MIVISILSSILIVCIFIIWNLLTKNEKAEDIIITQQEYINNISQVIKFTYEELKKLDEKDIFKSDDEIGFFFTKIKSLQEILNNFKVK